MEINSKNPAVFLMAFFVWVSIFQPCPNVTANLTARINLKASSLNLSSEPPTIRIILFSKSFCPPKGSISLPELSESNSDRPKAMAFTVKSRRAKSCSMLSANFISSGWRLSVYFASKRKVVASISFIFEFFFSIWIVTVRNLFS